MDEPVTPIFVFEGNDLSVLDDIADLAGVLEPADVEAVEIWDSSGSRLGAVVVDGSVSLQHLASDQDDDLDARLGQFCAAMGARVPSDRVELRAAARELAAQVARRKWPRRRSRKPT